MFERNIVPTLRRLIKTVPVVLLQGARQTGKSTLMKMLVGADARLKYVTLDDIEYLSSASDNPQEFIAQLDTPVIIDEVQKAPELFKAIKLSVDNNRQPGRFILTGSSQVLLLPKLSESLAGRLHLVTLYPLSQGEINQTKDRFVDFAFSKKDPRINAVEACDKSLIIKKVIAGGFPEPLQFEQAADRRSWYQSYVSTAIQRDITELAHIDRLTEMPKLLHQLAARLAGLLNVADLSSYSGIPQTSLARYLSLLEAIFFLHLVPAWSPAMSKRLVKSPKIYLNDGGLAAHLKKISELSAKDNPEEFGRLLENFVFIELAKQATWCEQSVQISHFRTHKGIEVDFILENAEGKIVGIEVKSAAIARSADASNLIALAKDFPRQFHKGFVLYCGNKTVPLSKNIWCLPLNALWNMPE